jgi:HNH endonuclease
LAAFQVIIIGRFWVIAEALLAGPGPCGFRLQRGRRFTSGPSSRVAAARLSHRLTGSRSSAVSWNTARPVEMLAWLPSKLRTHSVPFGCNPFYTPNFCFCRRLPGTRTWTRCYYNFRASTLNLPSATRIGIWQAYSRRCAYCGDPIALGDLDIDHIVPEMLNDKKEELERAKANLGLQADFEVNSLGNLVPAHRRCNLAKSGRIFHLHARGISWR